MCIVQSSELPGRARAGWMRAWGHFLEVSMILRSAMQWRLASICPIRPHPIPFPDSPPKSTPAINLKALTYHRTSIPSLNATPQTTHPTQPPLNHAHHSKPCPSASASLPFPTLPTASLPHSITPSPHHDRSILLPEMREREREGKTERAISSFYHTTAVAVDGYTSTAYYMCAHIPLARWDEGIL